MSEVSAFRLYALRAMYLFMAAGLCLIMWPQIIDQAPGWGRMDSVVACLLGAVGVMAAIGIRYPLKMLPLLIFELLWKTIWLVAVALPLVVAGAADAATWQSIWECLLGVILVPLVLPWRYVIANYVRKAGDPWRAGAV